MNTKNIFVAFLFLVVVLVSLFMFGGNGKIQNNLKEFSERIIQNKETTSNELVDDTSDISVNGEISEYGELAFSDNALDVSDWEMYQNEELGFMIRYPKDWEVRDELDKYSRIIVWPMSRLDSDDSGVYVSVSDKTIEGFIQDTNTNQSDFKFVRKFSHNGISGVIIQTKLGVWNESYPFPDERETIEQYVFDVGDHRITFYNPTTLDIFNLVFEQILLSFKLLK